MYVTHDQTEAMTLGDRVAVLRRGVLQQVASPRELYEQPVNLFVAGFIGSPPMNFLPATVGDGVLEMPFVNLPLPDAVAKAHKKGDLVIVGVRPEAFEDASLVEEAHRHEGVTFKAQVDVTEWLGNEKYAYLPFEPHKDVQAALNELDRELDGEAMRTQLVVTLDGSSKIRQGDDADLWLNPASIHVFDAESGDNMTRDENKAQQIADESEEDRKRELARAQEKEPLKV